MSSGRGAQHRPTPITPTPHPKQVISVEEWEVKAPLGEVEIKSVNLVKAASEKLKSALPFKVSIY
jgi:hypothetical protein